mmetsp:Transcript_8895/g.25062  ORF Transcript_8895/g.25062 Transcript_8895/m.25062 type:complete len:218 (-) Transcript_8895:434-1087(-)
MPTPRKSMRQWKALLTMLPPTPSLIPRRVMIKCKASKLILMPPMLTNKRSRMATITPSRRKPIKIPVTIRRPLLPSRRRRRPTGYQFRTSPTRRCRSRWILPMSVRATQRVRLPHRKTIHLVIGPSKKSAMTRSFMGRRKHSRISSMSSSLFARSPNLPPNASRRKRRRRRPMMRILTMTVLILMTTHQYARVDAVLPRSSRDQDGKGPCLNLAQRS